MDKEKFKFSEQNSSHVGVLIDYVLENIPHRYILSSTGSIFMAFLFKLLTKEERKQCLEHFLRSIEEAEKELKT